MASVKLEHVYKKYDGNEKYSVEDVSIYIPDGAFAVFVGPSGCGKSTTLRMIAGLEDITDGNIYIGDRLVNNVAPGDRKVAMVFQNYALYPTMTVRENIEFGLINNKVPKEERNRLISEISQIVSLDEYMDRRPSNLSGGQRQRVALARAMVKKPDIFILDEPLSNLDAKLRVQMRTELKKIHEKLGTTFIYVTHDQVEAMSMATQIIVMSDGHVMQDSKPRDVYNNPANVFTAKFIGSPPMNIIELNEGTRKYYEPYNSAIKYVGFRPEDAKIVEKPNYQDSLCILSNVENVEPLGSETIYTLENNLGSFQVKSYEKEIINKNEVIIEVKKENLNYFDKNQNLLTENQKLEEVEVKNESKERGDEFERSYQEKTTNSKTYSSN
ncbi:ABC transporter ATP-binding protein [Anaerococcus cruorum]|uniref:ABC transporter ATP-binding protein n=1 Tax=Anaerococcus sp. WGS1529 TaxID=3366812 RepID=UPI00372D0CDB